MRFLDTDTRELHEFFGSNIPPYAVLSHTWGEDEVSFQDMQSRNTQDKAGYDKIRHCCQLAATDGYRFLWADTCCIDKTSSSELSEAINSMYQWYRSSEVCYVYLADVPAHGGSEVTTQAFRKSRWFTRGWTLQELIAPQSVIFFDQHWAEIGTKESRAKVISEITTIEERILVDAEQMVFECVAKRMSYSNLQRLGASKRETTRVEDLAYCLIGIFGVNMPMIYGEGERAFTRLQEEIIRSTADHTIFAWTNTSNSRYGLLAQRPADFSCSGEVIRYRNSATHPFSMTNKGIHLVIPVLSQLNSPYHLAILDCEMIIGGVRRRLGIYLAKHIVGGNTYVRVSTDKFGDIDPEHVPKLKQEDVFVKEGTTINYFPLPSYDQDIYVTISMLKKNGIQLRQSYPALSGVPDRPTKLLAPKSSKIFGAFRFSDNENHGFMVLLKFTKNRFNTSLSSNIIDLSEQASAQVYSKIESGTCNTDLENELISFGEFSDRLLWQHPEKKWWISVVIKRCMISKERSKMLCISWHTPVEESSFPIC